MSDQPDRMVSVRLPEAEARLLYLRCDEDQAETAGRLIRAIEAPDPINLDLGDEHGYWIACLGHVDRYDFMCALDELGGGSEVLAKGPHPQHVYMIQFDAEQDESGDTICWWQLDPENPHADRVEPVTVLYTGNGREEGVTARRVGLGGEALA